ncbi:hypothetical protein [Kribbella sp. CA-293567]|uniref:hypothetical protein n=1 Tax=Kribbella sp. CA-293567 TaxID=3002436 RepID=UPI003FA5AA08
MLSEESNWSVGYAPDSRSRLVDHLRSCGFDFRTAVRAGLARSSAAGHPVDLFRDQLMLLARDDRMDAVGFVGVSSDERSAAEQWNAMVTVGQAHPGDRRSRTHPSTPRCSETCADCSQRTDTATTKVCGAA